MKKSKRIGLLGGSFNPAHAGHVYISKQAIKLLGLDEVWWLVSPQNPLKSKKDMAPFAARLRHAKKTAKHKKIRVKDLEKKWGTRYTFDTVTALKKRYPNHLFVWLTGADNWAELPRWHRWRDLLKLIPFAVFPRGSFRKSKLKNPSKTRPIAKNRAKNLALFEPPAWAYYDILLHKASSTALRHAQKQHWWKRQRAKAQNKAGKY
ncbi:MAG: nicotinate (nicotinamide) nucleotide adenylyltransferase [Dongiaceae bacterium]